MARASLRHRSPGKVANVLRWRAIRLGAGPTVGIGDVRRSLGGFDAERHDHPYVGGLAVFGTGLKLPLCRRSQAGGGESALRARGDDQVLGTAIPRDSEFDVHLRTLPREAELIRDLRLHRGNDFRLLIQFAELRELIIELEL